MHNFWLKIAGKYSRRKTQRGYQDCVIVDETVLGGVFAPLLLVVLILPPILRGVCAIL